MQLGRLGPRAIARAAAATAPPRHRCGWCEWVALPELDIGRLSAKIESSGSSEVKLTTRPERLETDRAGSGRVMFDDGSDAIDTPAPGPLPVSASKT